MAIDWLNCYCTVFVEKNQFTIHIGMLMYVHNINDNSGVTRTTLWGDDIDIFH